MDYEQFKIVYIQAFKTIFKYSNKEVGYYINLDKVVELEDAYPDFAKRAENDPTL